MRKGGGREVGQEGGEEHEARRAGRKLQEANLRMKG